MKVTLCSPQSYCAGVTNAIRLAYKAKSEQPNTPIYVLGMLVHNDEVIKELEDNDITTLYRSKKSDEALLYELKDGSIVIFSAHGHKKNLDDIAKEKEFIIYDATCPKVKKNLEIIKEELASNHQVIYIGHKDHPEALAALSLGNNVYFYDIKSDFNYKLIKDKSPLVINQTTLNVDDLKQIYIDIIVNKPKARILDEICNATRLRQESLRLLPSDTNYILKIGDKKSSNTNRLLEIAQNAHKDIPSYLISDIDDIKKLDIPSNSHIVIASGASTPQYQIDKIVQYLKSLK